MVRRPWPIGWLRTVVVLMTDHSRRPLPSILLFANSDWYLYNFRRSLALALRQLGYDVLLVSPPGPYGEHLSAMGLRWQPLRMDRRSLNPLREILLLFRLVNVLRRTRPALIHGFTIKCAIYSALAGKVARVPARVASIEGLGFVFSSDRWLARGLRPVVGLLMRWALGGRAFRLILQNPDDVALFRCYGLTEAGGVRVIPGTGVDCTRFRPADVNSRGGARRVLLASRLLWGKGIGEFVEAARLLRSEDGDVRFLVAGMPDAGNPDAIPSAQMRAWQDEGVIEWLGHVEDMPALLRTVDVFVLPSRYGEGVPLSLVEAAATGLALVTTDAPGCRDVVTHEVDGLLVPPRDSMAIAAAVRRLCHDDALRMMLGAKARAKALALFEAQAIIEQTLGVYEDVLCEAGCGRKDEQA